MGRAAGSRQMLALALVLVALHVGKAEPAFDAKVSMTDVMIMGGCHFDDLIVLDVQVQVAPNAAVGAYGGGLGLLRLVPGACSAHVVFGPEGQSSGRTDFDAVAAEDAGRIRQFNGIFGRNLRVEPAP